MDDDERKYLKPNFAFNFHCIIILILVYFSKKYYKETNVIVFVSCIILLFLCFIVEIFIVFKERISKNFLVTAIVQFFSQIYIIYYIEITYNTHIISYNLIFLTFSLILQLILIRSSKLIIIYCVIDLIGFILIVYWVKMNVIQIIFSLIYQLLFSFSSHILLICILENIRINFIYYIFIISIQYFSFFFVLLSFIKLFKNLSRFRRRRRLMHSRDS